MQNTDTDINAENKSGMVSVRDKVYQMREAQMQNLAMNNLTTLDYQSVKSQPATDCKLRAAQLPVNQNFFSSQQDVRAPWRGEAINMPGAQQVGTLQSNHTPEVVAFMKENATQLPVHVKSDATKTFSEAQFSAGTLQQRQLRSRVLADRQQRVCNFETSSAMPAVLSRPYSVNCREAEREKSAKTYTEGNEQAYALVEKHNNGAMGFKDTAATGAQLKADEFNARQRAAAMGMQISKKMISIPQPDAMDQSTQ